MAQPAALHETSAGQRVCAGKKLGGRDSTPTAKPPPFGFFEKGLRFEVQISFALRPDLARKSTKVTKMRSSPIRASLFSNRIRKKQRQEDGRLQVRGYSAVDSLTDALGWKTGCWSGSTKKLLPFARSAQTYGCSLPVTIF